MKELGTHEWTEVTNADDPHLKSNKFHETLITTLNKHFKEKIVVVTSLDKPWCTPAIKLKHSEMQKEFYKKGKTQRWKKLKSAFRRAKRKSMKHHYKEFFEELKTTSPSEYYKMAKRIGATDQKDQKELRIESIENLSPQEQVEKVAESFAAVSKEYDPVDLAKLPAYLPAEEPPSIEVYKVYRKIQTQKKTKSTLPIDLPESLRKEAAEFLAEPLTEILNASLKHGKYPKIWKKRMGDASSKRQAKPDTKNTKRCKKNCINF
jgi:hypothetical protein